jgi:acetolactate synthase-1/2/3 large subunit
MANGAESLLETLVDSGVEICFANPGTSEMHLVAAIGRTDTVRPILCLFEGVVTGAADGYARMTDKPAITLLHLGPGLANGMANLHNAKKAHVPLVNIVGDHAPYHLKYDAPLTSDVIAHAEINSAWVRVSESADDLAAAGAEAVQAALAGAGKIATLIAPANHAWEEAGKPHPALPCAPRESIGGDTLGRVASMLMNGRRTAFVLGGRALRDDALDPAGRIAKTCGAALLSETFPARHQRGSGRVMVARIPYFVEQAIEFLKDYEQLVLVGAQVPAAFFAYPDTPGLLVAPESEIEVLAGVDDDIADALQRLASAIGAENASPDLQPTIAVDLPAGDLTPAALADSLAILIPEHAILSDEGITCAAEVFGRTQGAAPHDWLAITGGAIGQGLPVSFGAAIACPDRKIIALQADGSAMYTVQTLWSMARENADVTVILLNNDSYAILNFELARLATGKATDKTLSMLDLGRPSLNWVEIATGMGVAADRATNAEQFHRLLADALARRGPRLIEAIINQRPSTA